MKLLGNQVNQGDGGRARRYLRRLYPHRLICAVKVVEKVPNYIPGRDAEKDDLKECATINDLKLGKDQVWQKRGTVLFSLHVMGRVFVLSGSLDAIL
jgi:hypothetical protein